MLKKCNELYYNQGNEGDIPNYVRWAALIYCEEFENIPDIVKGIMSDEERDRIMNKINKLTHDDIFMTELDALKWQEWEEKSKVSYAMKQGLEQGLNKRLKKQYYLWWKIMLL